MSRVDIVWYSQVAYLQPLQFSPLVERTYSCHVSLHLRLQVSCFAIRWYATSSCSIPFALASRRTDLWTHYRGVHGRSPHLLQSLQCWQTLSIHTALSRSEQIIVWKGSWSGPGRSLQVFMQQASISIQWQLLSQRMVWRRRAPRSHLRHCQTFGCRKKHCTCRGVPVLASLPRVSRSAFRAMASMVLKVQQTRTSFMMYFLANSTLPSDLSPSMYCRWDLDAGAQHDAQILGLTRTPCERWMVVNWRRR